MLIAHTSNSYGCETVFTFAKRIFRRLGCKNRQLQFSVINEKEFRLFSCQFRAFRNNDRHPLSALVHDIYNARVPVIQVVPVTEWSEKKARITTNVEIYPSSDNGLSKKSIADCLQTRPIDHRHRLVKIRGRLSVDKVQEINQALRGVFELNV